ncbi:MAG: DUF4384 domain-containing protein [Acidobacteria bacterium]|nr:DUF4384 domain-containing protein [Acidobacteriota bacterium]
MLLRTWALIALLAPAAGLCQERPGELTARTLFYREQPDEDKLPPVPEAKPAAAPKARPARKTPSAAIPVVQHLGLAYFLLLIDPRSGKSETVAAERTFKSGECLALEFEANRSGYLYVLEQGSSGKWLSLFPSALMPGESNVVRARSVVRVPARHCFEIEGVPGAERIFIVLSRNPEDLADLHRAIRTGGAGETSPAPLAPAGRTGTTVLAMNRIDREIARMAGDLRGRDLRIKRIEQPEAAGEPPNSVYVVNASSTPSDRVVTEIRIQHR